ncbi:bifunctional DNA-binding transcriptional regulator/O6-methylguanine-DNA methyltransferase Ada [Acidisphaera sp. L21]|uniref:bifunctional DNA-binding transcriptional regulator/O6-methylguanine-DNA methyltransferase Ada n=1 Tax=Acidisphaera sp. L21 TaxID=1641851 RepID=UPI0020B1431F|nr:bifunctional DNA-binding transcriptional regulator/O6-methylguanine-DNA methyltransferase Ada [Acidisphaera sp. L21]
MNAIAPATFDTEADRWTALRNRDKRADGRFLYAVATTGVYCHPSCAARPARPENVSFHADRSAAEAAGFRPCKRCKPDQPPRAEREAALVADACRSIEQAEEPPALDQLAAAAGLSPFHFHRLFRRIAGVTPKAYADARRADRVQSGLRAGDSVTEAMYDAGFNSSGRFYAAAANMLGMAPSIFRAGGAGETIRYATGHSTLGPVLVAATERGVCAILLGEDTAALQSRFPRAQLEAAEAGFGDWVAQVVAHVDAPRDSFTLPLDIQGTAFQRRVWEVLRSIPPGATSSYAQVAAQLGNPKAVRAVAGACAANKLAVVVPCHRVVGSNGALSGYRWGVQRKRALLDREAAGGAD